MTTRFANVKGIRFESEQLGTSKAAVAFVSFDLTGNSSYVGGSDTVQLGGGGYDASAPTASSLATIMQNRRRDGKTITLQSAVANTPGMQQSTDVYAQSVTISGGNVTLNLFTALSGGQTFTATAAEWTRPLVVTVSFTS